MHRWFPNTMQNPDNIVRTDAISKSRRHLVRLAAVFSLMTLASAAWLTNAPEPLGAAVNGRTLSASPAQDLGNEVIRLSWTGFTPTDQFGTFGVFLYQCKANPTSVTRDCFTARPFPDSANGNAVFSGRTSDDGTGSAFLEVRSTALLPELNCSASNACSIVAFEADGTAVPDDVLPATAAIADLKFAPSPADCPPVSRFDARAEGEASAAEQMYLWSAQLCTGANAQIVDYTETSSNSARESFLSGAVDLAVTSLPATADEIAAGKPGLKFKYAPISVNAVVVAYYLVDPVTGQRITDLKLSPRLIARLISNSRLLGYFQDPELVALNPGHNWPVTGSAPPLIRGERNADTRILTSLFAADAATQTFLAGNGPGIVNNAYKNYAYPVDVFENASLDTSYQPRQGSQQVASRVFYGVRPADALTSRPDTNGFFGVMDLATAARFDLPVASIVNAAGNAVAPDAEGLAAGLAAMNIDTNGFRTANLGATDPKAYPLIKVDHAMVEASSAVSAAKAKTIGTFFDYIATGGQTRLTRGVPALTPALSEQLKTVANQVRAAAVPATTTTSSSNSSTSTTNTPTTFDTSGTNTTYTDQTFNTGSGGGFGTDTTIPTDETSTPSTSTGSTSTPSTRARTKRGFQWIPIGSSDGGNSSMLLTFVLLCGLASIAARLALSPRLRRHLVHGLRKARAIRPVGAAR